MSNSTHLQLTLLEAAQAQKHVSVNETVQALDLLVQLAVKDRDLTTPPGSPADGDRYIPASGATGAWSGKAGQIAAYQDGVWMFHVPREGWRAWIDDENKLVAYDGSAWSVDITASGSGGSHGVCEGRLTLESGVAVSTSDQTAKTTVYFTPYKGNKIGLYNGASWDVISFSEISLSLSGYTADKNYDIWVYNNSGTATLDSTVWTNDTTRATALALQDGVPCKSGALTRRYVGTIRITGTTGQCEDSLAKRFVWSMYKREPRPMRVLDASNTWTYSTATWRQANNNTANQLAFVRGLDEGAVDAMAAGQGYNSTTNAAYVGTAIGLDATNAIAAGCIPASVSVTNTMYTELHSLYRGFPGLGYRVLTWLEKTFYTDGTVTWVGDNNDPTNSQHGIMGTVYA